MKESRVGTYKFIDQYLDRLIKGVKDIDRGVVSKIIEKLDECSGTIYIIGNGGSAATASHMANDLAGGLKLREIRNFKVYSLADNVALCTAIANDIGYENIFYAQLKNILSPEDVVIAISCSGNSSNIVKASQYCKEVGATLITLTGFGGGEIAHFADIDFQVPSVSGEYGLVEDIHMILDHLIYSYYISLKPDSSNKYSLK